MTDIKLVIIGHSDRVVDFDVIRKYKSKFFQFTDIERIGSLPDSQKNDGYLDIAYSKHEIAQILEKVQFDGLCVAVMNYRYSDNFYMHRIDSNKICISATGIEEILLQKDISIENFIIKNIYEVVIFYKILNNLTDNSEVYSFVHNDTRGCLFDMNGDKNDIIYNTENPIICDECKGKINKKPTPKNFLNDIEKELKNIKKPALKRIELFIKKYPLFSILITFVFSTFINLFSNWLWEYLKECKS